MTPTPPRTPLPGTPTEPPETPPPGQPWIDIWTNHDIYHAGDRFILRCRIENPGPPFTADQYIVLDVWGAYWFWSSWTPEVDFVRRDIAGGAVIEEVILDFDWPPNAGQANGIRFWAALLEPNTTRVIGEVAGCEFGFE
jgi:hypothetical protein